jgi:hypothetical protein
MALEEKLSAEQIARQAGMSSRPEFYSGRGAILCDLNSEHLSKIHQLIQKGHGDEAAENFVKMVANMKDLAASNFLTCFYFLESRGWEYTGFQSDLSGGIAVAKDREGNYDVASGMIGMVNALHSLGRDETEAIRGPFLERLGFKGQLKDTNRFFMYPSRYDD